MEQFIIYIDETTLKLQQKEKELIASDRKDEANLIKIKINVCGICKTLYNVASKQTSKDALIEDYIKRLTKLSEEWKLSYERAKEHDDIEKIVVEEAKLEVMEAVKNKFIKLCENNL